LTLCESTHIVSLFLFFNLTDLQTKARKNDMSHLQEQVKFWGGVNLQQIAKDIGVTPTYTYMVVSGKRQNPKVSSAVMQALNKRKQDLKRRLLDEFS